MRPTSPPLRHRVLEVHVRVRLNQKLRHLEMPILRSVEQRCVAILRRAPLSAPAPCTPSGIRPHSPLHFRTPSFKQVFVKPHWWSHFDRAVEIPATTVHLIGSCKLTRSAPQLRYKETQTAPRSTTPQSPSRIPVLVTTTPHFHRSDRICVPHTLQANHSPHKLIPGTMQRPKNAKAQPAHSDQCFP